MSSQDDISLQLTMSDCSIGLSPHEETLRELCKKILKSRFFRGVYEERRYVEAVNDYRDIVALHRSERDLEKLLLDVLKELHGFYLPRKPNMWIGITRTAMVSSSAAQQRNNSETFLWVELNDYAFGQYWFSIKSIRFRENEIIVKLKVVRAIGLDAEAMDSNRIRGRSSPVPRTISNKSTEAINYDSTSADSQFALRTSQPDLPKVDLKDFIALLQEWGTTIKTSAYSFMSNDINKDNIVSICRFLGLLIVSLCSGLVVGIKFLGVFTLRFMFEFSRLAHVMTPIMLKLIDVVNKIVGGFYILLAMIWKDAVVNRGKPPMQQQALPPIEYRRPLAAAPKSIDYSFRSTTQQRMYTKPGGSSDFERKFQ